MRFILKRQDKINNNDYTSELNNLELDIEH